MEEHEEEKLDILDDKGEKTGEVRTKDDVHIFGLPHKTVHVFFLNSKKQLLLQKRSKEMEAYPGYWYNSASGHVSSGQTSLEAAQRETEEEIGISLPQNDFQYLFTMEENVILNDGKYLNHEFNDVYLVHSDLLLEKFKIQISEVDEIKWVDVLEFKKWVEEGKLLVPQNEEYYKLLGILGY